MTLSTFSFLRKSLPIILLCLAFNTLGQVDNFKTFPYSTNSDNLTIWNGKSYSPITIKGINLGVATPGTFPSELNITYDQYYTWFGMMREAGFNLIRLYTLHYPQFYKALRDYNQAHADAPMLVIQGVWLEEELEGYNQDLFYLSDTFTKEFQDNVNCIHGNNTIAQRLGKAYGEYTADISAWTLGYIIGREVHPSEISATNSAHPDKTLFNGKYLSINNIAASEVFVTSMMDALLDFEMTNYETQRPVCFSSWPTLDPLTHPTETTTDEDKQSLDLANIDFTKAKAGVFISYHAYPYYPDFISKQPDYTTYSDYLGQNSYLGYLTDLKKHYPNLPLIIAEFGVPSSWGIAHYAQSGMNHGGFDERQQGENDIRIFNNILDAGCGGGIMFAWIDEWFKRTWITDPIDFDMNRRILWQNITAAEQNFGLIGFNKKDETFDKWGTECSSCYMKQLEATANFKYFKFKITTASQLDINDTLWIGIDTYDSSLGESKLPNGKTVTNRAEFALMINNNTAELYVTEAYDLYGIWHGISEPEQLYHSIATDGKPWKIVRWKNNQTDNEVQFIGDLKVNRLNQPSSSLDGVIITDNAIEVHLPWTLINFVDPSLMSVMNDDRSTTIREIAESDGIALTAFHRSETLTTSTRYKWEKWNTALNTEAYKKTSYDVIKERLPEFPGALIAYCDSFNIQAGQHLNVDAADGLLSRPYNFDGGTAQLVITENPKQGILDLNDDGSYGYTPDDGFTGLDYFTFQIINGANRSEKGTIAMNITGNPQGNGFLSVYPNPSDGHFYYKSESIINRVEIFDMKGNLIMDQMLSSNSGPVDISRFGRGNYFARFTSGSETIVRKLTIL